MVQRVLVNTAATLTVGIDVDGEATDPSPDTATVTVTRADGTEIIADATADDDGEGGFSHTVSVADNDLVDVLTATWTTALGILQTTTEVVGGFLFTTAQARRLKPLDDEDKYTLQDLVDARTLAETALEDACHVAFVPRHFILRLDGRGRTDLLLPIVRPLTITAATVDGTAVDVDDLELYDDGRVYRESSWGAGRRNIIIAGTHGYPIPPPRVAKAAMRLAKWALVDSPIPDRTSRLTTEDGTTEFVLAGVKAAVFDLPECNAIVEQYGYRGAFAVA